MKFGNAAWGFRETPLEEQFKITRDMGLSVIELGIANAPKDIPLDVADEQISNIKALAKKYDVNIFAAATGNDFTTGTEDISKIKRVIDICEALAISNLRIFTGFTPLNDVTDAAFDIMIASLSEVCTYAKEKGITPVIETHGAVESYEDGVEHIMSTTTDLDTLWEILSRIPDNAKLCFDPANLYAVGVKKPEIFFTKFENKVSYAHFKDFKQLSSGRLLPSFCGDSDMDWTAILETMRDFKGICLFEYENTEDIDMGLKKSYNFLKEKIECLREN